MTTILPRRARPALRTLRPRPQHHNRPISLLSHLPSLGPSPPQTIQARRTLSYPPREIYTLIADVDSYASFLPHCTSSRVTAWTPHPDASGHRWPTLADLTVGWGPFRESYTSRLYCVPGSVVEAVSGSARPTIDGETLARLGLSGEGPPEVRTSASRRGKVGSGGLFESLVTRWTVAPVAGSGGGGTELSEGKDWSDVTLSVRFQFANPALGFAVGQMADQMVKEMIQAFEDRAKKLYGNGRGETRGHWIHRSRREV